MTRKTHDITRLLQKHNAGDTNALAEVFAALYDELRRIAAARMKNERQGHSFSPTVLVHEAFLRIGSVEKMRWEDRAHFIAMTVTNMRRILIENARRKMTARRGGNRAVIEPFDEARHSQGSDSQDLIRLNELIEELAQTDARQARLVELKYFAGFSVEEVAHVLECSPDTVKREWRKARDWLRRTWKKDVAA